MTLMTMMQLTMNALTEIADQNLPGGQENSADGAVITKTKKIKSLKIWFRFMNNSPVIHHKNDI